MEEVKTIDGSYCARYSNALHNGFHSRIWQRLRKEADLTKIHVSDELITEYGENIAAETELNRETRAHADTAALADLDEQRDRAVSYILNVVEAAKNAPIDEVRKAGQALAVAISPYKGIQNLANDAETALIKGMLQDLRKSENAAHLTTLNLSAALTAADEANDEYETLQISRTTSRTANKKESTRTVRLRTDANYQRICDLVYASELLCAVPDDLPVITKVIDDFNGIIDEFKRSYNQSQGQKAAGKDTPTDDTDEPEQPATGGDEPTTGGTTEPDDRPTVN